MAEASPQPGRFFCHCCSAEIAPRLPVSRRRRGCGQDGVGGTVGQRWGGQSPAGRARGDEAWGAGPGRAGAEGRWGLRRLGGAEREGEAEAEAAGPGGRVRGTPLPSRVPSSSLPPSFRRTRPPPAVPWLRVGPAELSEASGCAASAGAFPGPLPGLRAYPCCGAEAPAVRGWRRPGQAEGELCTQPGASAAADVGLLRTPGCSAAEGWL